MDEDITLWVIDFLARQPISHLLFKKILTQTNLPVSSTNHPRFKKIVHLRHIQDQIGAGSVSSESILESLETVEELDRKAQHKIPDSMKRAYLAVAVDCTVKSLSDKGQFFEVVKRIWRERIEKLEVVGRGELVTDEVREFKDELEAALWNDNAVKRLLERVGGNDVLWSVRNYLKEAMDIMQPCFLEVAAKAERERIEKGNSDKVEVEECCEPNAGAELVGHASKELREFQDVDICDTSRPEKPGGITDTEKLDTGIPSSKFDTIPTPEVTITKEALNCSRMELKASVNDPLPSALHLSNSLVAEMERRYLNETSVENQNGKDIDAPNSSVSAVGSRAARKILNHVPSVETPNISVIHTMKTNLEIPTSSQQNVLPKPSLMNRNSTARTFEWDDSVDGLPEETANRTNKISLNSSRKRAVSPLRVYKPTKFTRRRQMKRWSLEEEDALREGVQKFGKGNWKLILNSKRDIFIERTEVDLKDKWRNLMKY